MNKFLCKITASILILALCFSFSGCNSIDNNPEESNKLTYYAVAKDYIWDVDEFRSTRAYDIDMFEKYNAYCELNDNDDYKIEIIYFDTPDEMYAKLSTEIMAGRGPDIFSSCQILPFEKLVQGQTLADIDELIDMYDYDIGLNDCNQAVMDAGVIDGKRFFLPLTFTPDVSITTEKTLEKYNLTPENFSFDALSKQLSSSGEAFSLFGNEVCNTSFFYSFLDRYIDFNKGEAEFETAEFSDNLDSITYLIQNDTTDENLYYFLPENINNGACVLYKDGSSVQTVVRTCALIRNLGGDPAIVSDYIREKDVLSGRVDYSLSFNKNSQHKEKLLAFAKYCLSDEVQAKLDYFVIGSLPVKITVFEQLIEEIQPTDFNDDGVIDENERAVFQNACDSELTEYLDIINNTSEYQLNNFYDLPKSYFNSSVIGDIVDDYLSGAISKNKFIIRLTAATEIYLTE